ncbi:coiled-coil domain-containing protein 40 [Octopus bimaculoides]|uniref:Coiled-coil domain-containing protein 40 n=1 Tax=Octopus bimaculoides TaxID=37653 RepID=A0A0L8FQM1_OCTBM|nr:coiled-coil domain-containing protein 40 [Octopus bimaculoides]|eukprot:XP_014787815.1 PREDICTED: coiled-coil domain-containing protein 40-like [Octopus bimaculoides]
MEDFPNVVDSVNQVSKASVQTEPSTDTMYTTTSADSSILQDEPTPADEEHTFLILDPDHPKMIRFQTSLKNYLTKMMEKTKLELLEVTKPLKLLKQEKEDVGVHLYGLQQELASKQMHLEEEQDKYTTFKGVRYREEALVKNTKQICSSSQSELILSRKHANSLRQDVENMEIHRFYLKQTKQEVGGDIKLLMRAVEKTTTDIAMAETEQKRQDFFVDRLVKRTNKLRNDIALYDTQYKLQLEETKNIRNILHDAELQLSLINQEKKLINHNWSKSLLGMKKRDEAYSAALDALRQLQEQMMVLKSDVYGYKKSTMQEQQENEKLTQILNKGQREVDMIREQLNNTVQKYEELKMQYSTYSQLLKETEENLLRTNAFKSNMEDMLVKMRKDFENQVNKTRILEGQIMDKINTQLMMEKSAKYVNKLTSQNRIVIEQLMASKTCLENDYSRILLSMTSLKSQKKHFEILLAEYEIEINNKNKIIDQCDLEIVRRSLLVNRKQNMVDTCQKKLEQLINKAGGIELGPLDSTIRSLQKSIDEIDQNITTMQQMWLQKQRGLVDVLKEREEQVEKMDSSKKELIIHTQKKIRTEQKLNKQNCVKADLNRSIKHCLNDIVKLNDMIHKELNLVGDVDHSINILEKDFIATLKEEKMNLVELQSKLEQVKDEKEDLLQNIVETDQQIMLVERKIQILKETRSAVDADFQQGEIRSMKSEIHRMEMRFSQLMRQQNYMIQDTERFLSRRDNIDTLGDIQQSRKPLTKGKLNKILNETKKKIKQIQKETSNLAQDLEELQQKQNVCGDELEVRQVDCNELKATLDDTTEQIDKSTNLKYRKMIDLLQQQRRNKYYQQVKDKRYKMLCKSKTSYHSEYTKQLNNLQTLTAIAEQICQEYPGIQKSLQRILHVLLVQSHKYMVSSEDSSREPSD